MSILNDTAVSARFEDGFIVVVMQSGAQVRFPAAGNPRLARGTPAQLDRIELSPFGLHWPDLDEDLSLQGIAQGDYGQGLTGRCSEQSPRVMSAAPAAQNPPAADSPRSDCR